MEFKMVCSSGVSGVSNVFPQLPVAVSTHRITAAPEFKTGNLDCIGSDFYPDARDGIKHLNKQKCNLALS